MRGLIFDGTAMHPVDDLELRSPGAKDVIVNVKAAGLCHSDLSVMDGTIAWPSPCVLGHEGAGVVEEVGAAVTNVRPGDHVVVATLASCGTCRYCNAGQPTRCRSSIGNISQPFSHRGQPVNNFAGTSVFTERTVVRDIQCVAIPKDIPLTSACLIGCGVVTGIGAVWNRADIQLGDTAIVFGVGGVGLNCIQGLRTKGAGRIIAVDIAPAKEALARQFGATDFIDGRTDVVSQVRELVPYAAGVPSGPLGSGGVNWAFDVVGQPNVTATAIKCLDWGGTCVIVGVPAGGTLLEGIEYRDIIHVERTIVGCRAGSYVPHRDIPLIVEMYKRGEVLLDELVSAVYPLECFDQLVRDLHSGTMARGVLSL